MSGLQLIAMVGVPGSGKSTMAARAGLPVVSSDDVRAELYGDEATQGNPFEVWAEVHARLAGHLAAGRSVILDATSVEPTYRAPLLEIARAYGAEPVAWRVTTGHRVSLHANRTRDRVVPDRVMNWMIQRYDRYCRPGVLAAEGWTVRNVHGHRTPAAATTGDPR